MSVQTRGDVEAIGAPAQLKLMSNEPLSLHMSEDSKLVYQAIGKAAGVNVLFDPDYISKRIQVELNNVSLLDALRIVGTLSGTFWRPITQNTIFVAANTRSKRSELDEQAVQSAFPGSQRSDASLDQRLAELDMEKMFGSLSEDQQKTLRLHFIEGYTLDEIAKMLGQTKGNIRHHSFRGLEKLRKLIFAGELPGTRAV